MNQCSTAGHQRIADGQFIQCAHWKTEKSGEM